MTRIPLSKRLETVAQFVPQGSRLADIGSDHAYLPLALLEQGRIPFAVAGEVVKGPYQSALDNVAAHGDRDRVEVRLADGLEAIHPEDQVETITICGMGGRLIAAILTAGIERLKGVETLILQPNNREDDVRTWLEENGWQLTAEAILEEQGKRYEILVAQPGRMQLSEKERRFGPYLLREQSPVFVQKWQYEAEKAREALTKIPANRKEDRRLLEEKIQAIEEVLS